MEAVPLRIIVLDKCRSVFDFYSETGQYRLKSVMR
jgi:hypothetical protein